MVHMVGSNASWSRHSIPSPEITLCIPIFLLVEYKNNISNHNVCLNFITGAFVICSHHILVVAYIIMYIIIAKPLFMKFSFTHLFFQIQYKLQLVLSCQGQPHTGDVSQWITLNFMESSVTECSVYLSQCVISFYFGQIWTTL